MNKEAESHVGGDGGVAAEGRGKARPGHNVAWRRDERSNVG